MHHVNLTDIPVEHRRSPRGDFELQRQHVSLALGGVKDTGPWGGGHPFDVELVTLAPGKKNYPLHSHAAQTEHYIILSGSGVLTTGEGADQPLRAGDHLICHPGEAHQITSSTHGVQNPSGLTRTSAQGWASIPDENHSPTP